MSQTKRILFCGLDPVPVPMVIADGASEEEMFAAACMPSSVFMQTVRPYRLRPLAADRVELIVGPEGFGGVLLEALQWMARVTAAGILGVIAQDRVVAFVKQVLERDKPEWRFEETSLYAVHSGRRNMSRLSRLFLECCSKHMPGEEIGD